MKQNLRIIVIDDNPSIHQDFIKILTTRADENTNNITSLENVLFEDNTTQSHIKLPEFEIDTANQGQEGYEKIEAAIKEGRPYALAFVDIRMPPGWDGVETIKRIWDLDSNIEVVICTAYSDYSWEETVEQLGNRDNLLILKKPFDNIAVRQLACALTKKWQLVRQVKDYTTSLEERVAERTKSLQKSLSLMKATLESSADGILVVTCDGKIKNYNKKFIEMFNVPSTVMSSENFWVFVEYISGKVDQDFTFQAAKLAKEKEHTLIENIKFVDGRIYEYYTQPYSLENKIIGRVWSFRDITKRAFLEEELYFQATHDSLTGLPNRVYLLDKIRQAMNTADQEKTKFCVLFLDLDRFKLINDSLSHQVGDEILRMVADRIQGVLNCEDVLVRLGGDEFVVMAEYSGSDDKVTALCNQILNVFNSPFMIYGHEILLSTSIGVSLYPKDGVHIEDLLRDADLAMYHAKEIGSNHFQFYSEEFNKKNLDKLEKETELRKAITNNEFYLKYQPQFDLKTQRFVSVEALIRWKHPVKGEILPLDFIPIAEESGLIIPIGEWVLRTACQQIKEWQNQGLPHIRVAVNITTKQFRLYDLAEVIGGILSEIGLEPQYLELELTENMIVNNADVLNNIRELKKMGVQIVLDDFGTGYSSLNYLREIPVDRLKIDQSYVQNIDSNRGDDVIIQAIISMANNLHLEVLAEGVETQKQLDFLKKQKCGEVQGYYFSKPLTPLDCEKLLRESTNFLLSDLVE